jgi:hypothetical protein
VLKFNLFKFNQLFNRQYDAITLSNCFQLPSLSIAVQEESHIDPF